MANSFFPFFSKKEESSPITALSPEMVSFLEQYPLALLLVDATGRITFANPSAAQLLHTSHGVLVSSYVDRFGLTMEKIRTMAQTNPPKKIIIELVNDQAETVYVGAAASFLASTPFLMLTLESIPHFTQLTTNNQFLRSLLDASPSALVVQNLAGICSFWSNQARELFSYTEQDVLGQEIYPFLPKELVPSLQRLDAAILQERASQAPVQLTYNNAEGKTLVLTVTKIFLPAENGKDLRILTLFSDITQQYYREQELLQNRTLLRAVLDNVPLGLYTRDCDNQITFYNRQSLKVLNEQNEENVGRAHAYQSQKDVNMHKSREAEILREGKIKDYPEEEYTDSQGNKKILHLRKVPLMDAGPKPLVLSIVEDITEHLKQEKEIKRINKLLTAIVQNAPVGLYARLVNGRMLLRNQQCSEIFGTEAKAPMFDENGNLPHETPEQISSYISRERELVESGKILHIPEEPYVTADGTTKLLRMIKVPVVAVENNEKFVVTLVEDITARKAQEKDLLETKNFLQTLLDNVPVAIYARGVDDTITFINRRAQELFPGEEASRTETKGDFYDKREQIIFEKGENLDIAEETYTQNSGKTILLHLIKAPVFDKDGKPFMVLTVAEDITQKKAQEKEIINAKNFLQNVINNLPVSLSVKDYNGKYILWNKKSEELFGVSSKEVMGKTSYRTDMNQEQLEFVREGELKVFDSKKEQSIPQELISTAKEGVKIMHTVKTPVFNEDGTPNSLIIVSEDITAKTKLEKQIREASDKNTLLVENAREGVLLLEEKKIMYVNRALCHILGYTDAKSLTGKTLADLTLPDYRDLLRDKCEEVLSGSQEANSSAIIRFSKENGETVEVEFSAVASRYLGRRILLCFMRDMTEFNRTQRELTRERESYRQAFEQSSVPSFLLQSNGYMREMNDTCRKLFGLDATDKTFYRNVYIRPALSLSVRRKLRAGEATEMDYEFDFARAAQKFPDRIDGSKGRLPLHLVFKPLTLAHSTKKSGGFHYIVTVFPYGKAPTLTPVVKPSVQLLRKPLPPLAASKQDAKEMLMLPNSEPYVLCTADFKMRTCNSLFCELCQLTEQELLGQQIRHLIDDSSKEQFENDLKLLVQTGTLSNRDYFLNPASGLEKIAIRLTAIATGKDNQYLFVLRNQTGHMQLVKVLEERTARLNALLESTDGIVFAVQISKGKFTMLDNVSQALSQKVGFSQDKLTRMPFKDLFVSSDEDPISPVFTQAQQQLAQTGKASFTRAVRCQDGSTFQAQVVLASLDISGEQTALAVLRDITAERDAWSSSSKEAQELTSMRSSLPGLYLKAAENGTILEVSSNLTYLPTQEATRLCKHKTPKQIWGTETGQQILAGIREALSMNLRSQTELTWKLPDESHTFEVTLTPITGRKEVILWLKDISQTQQQTQQVRDLYRLTGEPGLSLTEQVDKILAFGVKAFRADVGFVLRFAPSGRNRWESHILYVTDNMLQLEDATSFVVEECLRNVQDGTSMLWPDLSALSCRNCVHIKKAFGSMAAAPLVVGGKVMGALCFASQASRRSFEAGADELLGVLARLLSLRIELRQTGKMLSEASRSFARTLEYVEKPAVILDLDYQITFVNTAFLAYTGLNEERTVGRDFFDFVRNSNLAKRSFQDAASEADGNSFDVVLEVKNKLGTYQDNTFNIVPCKDDNGGVASYALVATEG